MPSICIKCYKKQAKFGTVKGERLYCKSCKSNNHYNYDDICIIDKCTKSSNYNLVSLRPLYCYEHKSDDMINLKNKQCIIPECNITASFNIMGNMTCVYCYKHKMDDMVNVKRYSKKRKMNENNIIKIE